MTITKPLYIIENALRSPIILTGPHNGWHVPEHYARDKMPLGLDTHWFDPSDTQRRRHEACDWGIQHLFERIAEKDQQIVLMSATHSRLIADLNRNPNSFIYARSSELETDIPGNLEMNDLERQSRLDTYYTPYHDALDTLLQDTKSKFGRVLWLDMHSFTPLWQGQPRAVGIGTLKTARSTFTDKAESWLSETFNELFEPDQPYSMALPEFRNMSGGHSAALRNNVPYFGLEIRNDLLQTPEQIEDMADKMLDLIKALEF